MRSLTCILGITLLSIALVGRGKGAEPATPRHLPRRQFSLGRPNRNLHLFPRSHWAR